MKLYIPPGLPAGHNAFQGSRWKSPVSLTLRTTMKNNFNHGHLKSCTRGRKASLKEVAEKEVTTMKICRENARKLMQSSSIQTPSYAGLLAAGLQLFTRPIEVKYLWCHLLLGNSFLARFSTRNLNHTKAECPFI